MAEKNSTCCHCGESIPKDAAICSHCRKSQGRIAAQLEAGAPAITVAALLVSIGLLIMAGTQSCQATKQLSVADQAMRQAETARDDARKTSAEAREAKLSAENARDEARKAVEYLRANIKLLLEVEHLKTKLTAGPSNIAAEQEVLHKLEEFAVPNKKERKDWLESLEKLRER